MTRAVSKSGGAIAGLPAGLGEGVLAFEGWRRERTGRRIPESLWSKAVSLAKEFGVTATSRALRLNVQSLGHRLRGSKGVNPGKPPAWKDLTRGGFVELASVPGMLPPQECWVEVESRSGSKLKIQFRGPGLPSLEEIRQSFWRDR